MTQPRGAHEPYVFVSYTSTDRDRVRGVVDRLQAAGVRVWLDERNISGATIYGNEIVEGIKNCAALVIMCSAASLRSRNVRQEIQLGWKYERPYLPLLLEQVTFPQELEYWLEGWQWVTIEQRPEAEWLPQVLEGLGRIGLIAGLQAVAADPASSGAGSLNTTSKPAAPSPAGHVTASEPIRAPARRGERKLVTILAAEVTGAEALAALMDPEEARIVVSEARAGLVEAIARHEGYVAKLTDTAVTAFFGVPLVHEDDAERAVRTALAMIERTRGMAEDVRRAWGVEDLDVRAGLHTAQLELNEAATEFGIVGDAVDQAIGLAEQIRAAAPPFGLLASTPTIRQVRRRFECRSVPALPGFDRGGELFEVAGDRASRARDSAGEAGLSPLVGRATELATIQEALTALHEGHGQIVALVGEAGIGKSRLIEEAQLPATGETAPVRWLEGRSLSYGGSLPYWAITQILKADMGLSDRDPEARLRVGLRRRGQALLGESAAEQLPLLAHLLGVKLDADAAERIRALDGETLKHQVVAAVTAYLTRLADERPTVLVFEDLHWADPSTLEAIEALLALTDRAPLLLLLVFRPEREHGSWRLKLKAETDFGHRYAEVSLKPLSAGDAERLAQSLIDMSALPDAVRRTILDRSEGNPLYVEEIVRNLIEQHAAGSDPRTGDQSGTADPSVLSVPETLQGVLLARIDRLDEGPRRTLQLASIIGRSFSYRLLAAVSGLNDELDAHLTQLQRADLVREKTRRPELEYLFKHSLTQEAAYGSLSAQRRREQHAAVGEAIETLYAQRLQDAYGLLAHHFGAAGDRARTFRYALAAGKAAAAQFASEEALGYFRTALQAATTGAENDAVLRERERLLRALFRGREAVADLERLLADAREAGDRGSELEAFLGLGAAYYIVSLDDGPAISSSREYYEQAYALARDLGDKAAMVRALVPTNLFVDYWPDYRETAIANASEAVALSHELGDEGLIIEAERAQLRFLSGVAALDAAEALRMRLEERGDLVKLNEATFFLMWRHLWLGNFERCVARCDDGIRLAAGIGALPVQYPTIRALALLNLGRYDDAWASLQQEVADEAHSFGLAFRQYGEAQYLIEVLAFDRAVELLRHVTERARQLNRAWMLRGAQVFLAKTLARSGQLSDAALAGIEAELGQMRQHLPADALAEVYLARGEPEAALVQADKAVSTAAADGRRADQLPALETKLRVLLCLDRLDDVVALAGEALALALDTNWQSMRWRVLATRAQAYTRLGNTEAAAADTRAAAELNRSLASTIPDPELKTMYESDPLVATILGAAQGAV
ncbi:MAG: AAA family ATPase [Dehalococcoidia bacterium]